MTKWVPRKLAAVAAGPQLVRGSAADNASAASERVVAIAVLSQLERRAEVLDRTALALALCSLIPMLS